MLFQAPMGGKKRINANFFCICKNMCIYLFILWWTWPLNIFSIYVLHFTCIAFILKKALETVTLWLATNALRYLYITYKDTSIRFVFHTKYYFNLKKKLDFFFFLSLNDEKSRAGMQNVHRKRSVQTSCVHVQSTLFLHLKEALSR